MDGSNSGRPKEGLFDTVSPNPEGREDSPGKAPSAAHVMQALTRYIMQKDKGGPTVKALYNQRKLNETIFEAVFEEFAKGQRLQPYAQYRLAREARLAGRCSVAGHDHHEKKVRVSRKDQAQKQLDALAKKVEQLEAAKGDKVLSRYMQYGERDEMLKKKRRQVQYVKSAVKTNEMTIDEANSLMVEKTKSDNKDLVKGTAKSKQFR